MNTKQQYIYVLKLYPIYLDQNNWTENEDKIVKEHFEYLTNLKKEGKLILAGRTQTWDEKTFGIVILNVDSLHDASEIMQQDPGVSKGLMTAELFPFKIAI
jgi:uncharacterized protein YciI